MCRALLFLAAFLTSACSRPPAVELPPVSPVAQDEQANEVSNDKGRQFLAEVLQTLQRADQVVVVEHSHELDLPQPGPNDPPYREHSYKRVTLSNAQLSNLKDRLERMSPHVPSYVSACVFIPHHRLEFLRKGKQIRRMEVCLSCGQMDWDGAFPNEEPSEFYGSFSDFLKDAGLEPDRNWERLARGSD